MNAVSSAADADVDAEQAGARLVKRWPRLRRADVFASVVSAHAPLVGARYAGEVPARGA